MNKFLGLKGSMKEGPWSVSIPVVNKEFFPCKYLTNFIFYFEVPVVFIDDHDSDLSICLDNSWYCVR